MDTGDGPGRQIFQLLALSGGRAPVSISCVLSSPPAPEVDMWDRRPSLLALVEMVMTSQCGKYCYGLIPWVWFPHINQW